MECAAAKKLAQQAVAGHALAAYRFEEAQQAEQALGLGLFGHVARHLVEDFLGKLAHHAKLENQR